MGYRIMSAIFCGGKKSRNKKLLRDERGGVLIFIGLSLALLITAMGIAIDMGRTFLVRSKAMTALDAAIIGAASSIAVDSSVEALEARAREYFDANFPTGYMGATVSSISISVDKKEGSVSGDVDISLPTLFGELITSFYGSGKNSVDMNIFSTVERKISKNLEIALVLDTTYSMCDPCSKMEALIDSVRLLTSSIDDAIDSAAATDMSVYYSHIPFIHTVRVDGSMKHQGSYASSFFDYLRNLKGLDEDSSIIISSLQKALSEMRNGSAAGGTNTAVGTWWGWRSLREDDVGLFVGESRHDHNALSEGHPSPINDPDTFKTMIIMTDGRNEFIYKRNKYHDTKADAAQAELCRLIKREGITIYSIAFRVQTASARDLLQECASSPSHYYNAENENALRAAFQLIADAMIDITITK